MTKLVLMALVLSWGSAWSQEDDRYALRLTSGVGPQGTEQRVYVLLDIVSGTLGAPSNVAGYSFGVCHDQALLALVNVLPGSDLKEAKNGFPPDFYVDDQTPQNGAGWTVGVIIDTLGVNTLDPGVDFELNEAFYDLIGPEGSVAVLEFCDTLGTPIVQTLITVANSGNAVTPVQESGEQRIGFFDFVRGDCDGDGDVQISDAVFALEYLFPQSGSVNPPGCQPACDANDDDTLDLGDVIAGVVAVFGQPSVPLPSPYPGCGTDPTPGSLNCVQATLCP